MKSQSNSVMRSVFAVLWCLMLAHGSVFAQTQVFVIPPNQQVVYSGDPSVQFECVSVSLLTIQSIEWQINWTSFDDMTFSDIQQRLLLSEGSNTIRGSSLTFTDVQLLYNTTTIQCTVEYSTGSRVTSDTTSLLVQGTLDGVELTLFISGNSEVFLNWTAPFTLLGASEITYCVDVVDSTNRRTLQSECEIRITQFTSFMRFTIACGELSFSVTPVNVVGNGTTSTIIVTDYSSVPIFSPKLVEIILMPSGFLLVMSAPVCHIELRFVDVDTGETITLRDTNATITETNFTFLTPQLRENHRYDITITASNIAGNSRIRLITGDMVPTTTTDDIRNLIPTKESTEPLQSDSEAENFTIVMGMGGGLVIFTLVSITQSVVIVILCCKIRQKAPIQPSQLGTQLYEEVRDLERETTAPTRVSVRSISPSKELAAPVPQYEDITLPVKVATKSGDPYQVTQCAAYGVPNANFD